MSLHRENEDKICSAFVHSVFKCLLLIRKSYKWGRLFSYHLVLFFSY